jgi:hypothetical protein
MPHPIAVRCGNPPSLGASIPQNRDRWDLLKLEQAPGPPIPARSVVPTMISDVGDEPTQAAR